MRKQGMRGYLIRILSLSTLAVAMSSPLHGAAVVTLDFTDEANVTKTSESSGERAATYTRPGRGTPRPTWA